MASAKIFFSDKSVLTVNENDRIIPIVQNPSDEECFVSMSKAVTLYDHIHNGLIPSILDALCFCQFFYIGDNDRVVYCTNSIIKIEIV